MEKLEKLLETVLNQRNYPTETQEILDRVKINTKRQKRLYEGILSNTPDWAYILDTSHRFIYANSSLLEAFGKSWNEVIGENITELVDKPIEQQIQQINKVINNQQQVRGELHVDIPEGEQIYDYIFVPILNDNGAVEAVAGTSRNITDRITAEKELETELARMRNLQQMSTDLMFYGDIQAQLDEVLQTTLEIMDADKGTIQILEEDSNHLIRRAHKGYTSSWPEKYKDFERDSDICPTSTLESQEQITIPNVEESNLLNEEVRKDLMQEGVQAVQATVLRSRTKQLLGIITTLWEQEYHPSEQQFNLLKLLAQQVSNWIEQYRVNQDLRETRQRLQKANSFLEERIRNRTNKLQERASKLQDLAARLTTAKQQERKRIATVLHDDLQQLLVSAKMHIGLLNEDEKSSPNIDKAVQMLDQAVEVSRNLTSRLHPPALHEEGFLPALEWLSSDMKERHHLDVEINVDGENIDNPLNDQVKVLLFECSRELLFNTVKYAEVNEAAIHIHERDNYLKVVIEDEGIGFDVEEARTNTEGFGLFSVLERLEAFGGSANIESKPGEGTSIELKVPVTQQKSNPEGKSDEPQLTEADNIYVLIVDDHAMVREGITNILQTDKRFKIDEAKDGMEAIEKLKEDCYDVILMDVRIPRMNGIEATKQIHRRWPDTAVIGMSAREDDDTRNAMLNAGAETFIPKSGDSNQMIKVINKIASDSTAEGGNN